jgi:hypothetical protein
MEGVEEWEFIVFHVQKHTLCELDLHISWTYIYISNMYIDVIYMYTHTHTHTHTHIYIYIYIYHSFSTTSFQQTYADKENIITQNAIANFTVLTYINHAYLIYYLSFEKNILQFLCNDFSFFF